MNAGWRLPGWQAICVGASLLGVASGCESMTTTDKGVVGGGLLGAGTGALIGSATGNADIGAVAGAGLGAIAGGLVGNSVEQAEHKAEAAHAQAVASHAQAQRQLGMTDVVGMAQQHISDPVIINQIRSTGSVYHLSPSDIQYLKANGVSDAVVMEMQGTARRPVQPVYTSGPTVVQPVYVRPRPRPVRFGVGVGYYKHRHCH